MPSISLVVCVRGEHALLQRMLAQTAGLYDELVVVHDGEEEADSPIAKLISSHGGRFFVCSRAYQQEPHWPFAWSQAKYDWILRLDADEFPSPELKEWLSRFRAGPEPSPNISGYTCIWPLWNGRRTVSRRWAGGRIFLFNRLRVAFFGMAEQTPVPDDHYEALEVILHHQPPRKSFGLKNILVRPQAYRWRERIAKSLLGKPTDLQCWRWKDDSWPEHWEQIRQAPLRTALSRLILETLRSLRDQWRRDWRFYPSAAVSGPIHHALICLKYLCFLRTKGNQVIRPPKART